MPGPRIVKPSRPASREDNEVRWCYELELQSQRDVVGRRGRAERHPPSIRRGRATEVIAAGWPGERIGTEAALNRAYVALSSLRKKGLHELLVRTGGGYALSPAVAVRRMD